MASQAYYGNAAPVDTVHTAPATTTTTTAPMTTHGHAPPKEDFVTTHADKHGAALQAKMGIKETETTKKYRKKIIGFLKKYIMKQAISSF